MEQFFRISISKLQKHPLKPYRRHIKRNRALFPYLHMLTFKLVLFLYFHVFFSEIEKQNVIETSKNKLENAFHYRKINCRMFFVFLKNILQNVFHFSELRNRTINCRFIYRAKVQKNEMHSTFCFSIYRLTLFSEKWKAFYNLCFVFLNSIYFAISRFKKRGFQKNEKHYTIYFDFSIFNTFFKKTKPCLWFPD